MMSVRREHTKDEQQGGPSHGNRLDRQYEQLVELLSREPGVSVSLIQRRLRVGYNTAARLMERMEAEGIVGPPPVVDCSRKVLLKKK